MLLKNAFTLKGPCPLSMFSLLIVKGSILGTSRSVNPDTKYGRKWLNAFLKQVSISGSNLEHGIMYSAKKNLIQLKQLTCRWCLSVVRKFYYKLA